MTFIINDLKEGIKTFEKMTITKTLKIKIKIAENKDNFFEVPIICRVIVKSDKSFKQLLFFI